MTTWCIDLDGSAALRAELTAAASRAAPISALHTPPLGVGRPPAASRALLSADHPSRRISHAATTAATDKD